jgi:hypothetical protein
MLQACYVIRRGTTFFLAFNGEGGAAAGPARQGRRQRGALGLPHGPVRRPSAALGALRRPREGALPNGRDPQGLGERSE